MVLGLRDQRAKGKVLMVTVVAIRDGRCAVCVDDCGKSLTLPLDRLPVGTVAGSRLSLEAVLGLPASAASKNRGVEKSGASACDPSTLARQGVGGASGGHKGRRMIVTEVRSCGDAVLVAENGATMLRDITKLPGRIRPGDVFLVAEAHVERDRECEQWSDEWRSHSVARAQQLRLHPLGSDPTPTQWTIGKRQCAYRSPEEMFEMQRELEKAREKAIEVRAREHERQRQEQRALERRQEQERIAEALRRGDYRRPNEDWREHE